MTPHPRHKDLLLFSLLLLMILAACAPYTRYRVLSFFFDGVPNPNAPGNGSVAALTQPISDFRQAVSSVPRDPARPLPPKIVSVHKPVADRQCAQCHDVTQGQLDVMYDARLCDKCHYDQRVNEGWDHGPINLGTCIPCHKPHDSIYEHLLDQPIPDLCLGCHTEQKDQTPDYHLVENFDDCTACHDPHRMY